MENSMNRGILLFALIALCSCLAACGAVQAQDVRVKDYYNPYIGGSAAARETYNPYTGKSTETRAAYNPYTGKATQESNRDVGGRDVSEKSVTNPYTGRSYEERSVTNPY